MLTCCASPLGFPMCNQDAAIFLRDSEDQFLSKIKSVVLVGGVGGVARDRSNQSLNDKNARRRSSLGNMLALSRIETEDPILPDNSDVNQMDMNAAQFFYMQYQRLGIQLIMIPNEVRNMEARVVRKVQF